MADWSVDYRFVKRCFLRKIKAAIYQVKQTAQEGLLYQKEMNIVIIEYYTTKDVL